MSFKKYVSNTFIILFITAISVLFCAPIYATESVGDDTIMLNPKDVERFSHVLAQIKQLYVTPVKSHKLFSGAIRGMLADLDPHSAYLDKKTYQGLQEHTKGKFVGLGIEVTQEKGIIKVISPIDDTPAEKAGIKPGDYILAANGNSLIEKPLNEAVQEMRGKKGTTITLTVINEHDKKPRKISIKRDVINVTSVKSKLLDDRFGYIRISHFQHETGKKLIKAIKTLEKKSNNDLNGLILDLRNNPGGILESSVDVSNTFLNSHALGKNKLIVYAKGQIKSSNISRKASGKDMLEGAPLIVLINNGSASAAEIVAGALKDHKRAIIMGQRSFGKGSVQTVIPLDRKTAIKLTTAMYYTPLGHLIQAKGIQPDIVVEPLKLKKPKEETLFIFSMHESDLKGHIKNGDKTMHSKLNHRKNIDLATSDYQLYEALQLLKSMHIVHERKK